MFKGMVFFAYWFSIMPKRTDIRTEIETLITGLTTTGANVSTSRVSTHVALPSLVIVSSDEELYDVEDGYNIRRYLVDIEARVDGADTDDTLDLIDSEVFDVLEASKLSGEAMDTRWVTNSKPELSGEGDTPIGLMILTYEVIYATD